MQKLCFHAKKLNGYFFPGGKHSRKFNEGIFNLLDSLIKKCFEIKTYLAFSIGSLRKLSFIFICGIMVGLLVYCSQNAKFA